MAVARKPTRGRRSQGGATGVTELKTLVDALIKDAGAREL